MKRRAQVEHLINWQRKLDKEEERLKLMEQELLGVNMKKLSSPKKKKRLDEDFLNTSIKMVKSIDKSLLLLDGIEPKFGEEIIEVSGEKLNKLWNRLTGNDELKYKPEERRLFGKQDFSQFYEEAKEFVLQSDLKWLLETSAPQLPVQEEEPLELKEVDDKQNDESDVDTMNSIANIETEEEFPGSAPFEPETPTSTASENDEELQQMLANQMRVFLDHKKPTIDDEAPAKTTPTIDNATFQVRSRSVSEDFDISVSSDMDIEKDSLIQTEPLLSIDNSSVDADGSIIPEIKEIQITDMDEDYQEQLIEDISFPNLEISANDVTPRSDDRNDLSTITECTEYEQSQGSSHDDISSDVVSQESSATASEKTNSEIEKRLISINDSLEEVNEAFKKIAIINRSPSSVTYSTDKDFIDSQKASSSGSHEKSETKNLLMFSPSDSESLSGSQITTSTPKILMPDILSDVSDGKKDEVSGDF